ncbi:uncharacterized protein AMSG_01538 [Thecamonas trahens ATCC 50062]|uniref:Iron-binding zinc finger CDGSH type domain-containing protein n=1 Tax=Thecamonas trahens ATCC 50062 TaxID=461836 RepID=A0A0L0DQX8_THETB|nr:hypothetical protein AMSG_01538 [Thecamonas trahens ATCC 50062]KNC54687.1 hypothetical protein AMSG_01538 [Thecamonas trahens ATCC 50062]|eukprot:XP_013761589.1 hypothetical protein AMSG_01538 [Thecamonas trahens ATCC 50062]
MQVAKTGAAGMQRVMGAAAVRARTSTAGGNNESVGKGEDGSRRVRAAIDEVQLTEEHIGKGKRLSLCRCWASATYPLCDGAHKKLNLGGDIAGPIRVTLSPKLAEQLVASGAVPATDKS